MISGDAMNGAGAGQAPALSFSEVTFAYREGLPPALAALDLTVAPGEFVTVVGGNGSGKSTLARLANGLLLPQRGTVRVDGLDTADHAHRWAVHAKVGLLFQDPEDQIVGASVEDDVAFGLENLGVPRAEMRRRVPAAIAAVGLAGEETTEPHLLSGGQKQRLALAGVMVLEPTVLVLDEPTSMLDPAGRAAVLSHVRELTARGVAVVMITQHMDEAVSGDRLVALSGGRLIYEGDPVGFFRSGAADELPLGDPPAMRLAAALEAALEATLGRPLPLTVDELVERLRPVTGRARGAGGAGHRLDDDAAGGVTRPPVVEFTGVSWVYNARAPFAREALRGVDLRLLEGCVTAVIGATAAGKSTLLQLAAGLLRPSRGRVLIAGAERPRPGTVAMAFQRAEVQLFASTVEADVAFGPRLGGLEGAALDQRVAWALETVGLDREGFGQRMPHSLSVGEQRRVALAGVLSLDPPLLVLDEPGSGLDPAGRRRLMRRLVAWSRAGGAARPRTLVFTSHDMDEVVEWADRAVLLHDGRVVADGSVAQVLGDAEALVGVGLRMPLAGDVALRLMSGGSEDEARASVAGAPGPPPPLVGEAGGRRSLPVDAESLALWLRGGDGGQPSGESAAVTPTEGAS